MMVKISRNRFVDAEGRAVQLRGVNLGGSSKVPRTPDGATWRREGFYDHRNVSFIGRPFPLEEADEHFSRLKGWGFPFLRFLVTWEAIEHAGPGCYDEAYLEYIRQIVEKAAEHEISLFIDPHQDVWSRFTGGDGAPGWTLEAVGMDLTRLHATGAALLHQEQVGDLPRMIWPSNINRLAAATMFTLFFGGDDFAPHTQVEAVPIQEYLQSHYIEAIQQLALRLKDLPNVLGYELMNEPYAGYIGAPDVAGRAKTPLLKGESPTIFQAMLSGSGYPQEVDVYGLGLTGFMKKGSRVINRGGQSIWLTGYEDVWKQNGVWGLDSTGKPQILIPDYFSTIRTSVGFKRTVDFNRDYYKPFANRFAGAIRSVSPNAILFVEGVPETGDLTWGADDAPDIVHAAHWYDGLTLMNKSFHPWFTVNPNNKKIYLGRERVRQCFSNQIATILRRSGEQMNGAPTLIGETGIPFDMQNQRAFRTGDYSMQTRALDATMNALESTFASFTLWNYTADNTNEHGDGWNEEDLSIFSRDQQMGTGDIYDGGRALPAVIRPYAVRIPGQALSQSFDIQSRIYRFSFRYDPGIQAPLVIFFPAYHYSGEARIEATNGAITLNRKRQELIYLPEGGEAVHHIFIRPI